jgi:hypothetical protein
MERHGIKKGIEKGELIGQIRLYQQLLGQLEQPREQFLSRRAEALQSKLSEFQHSFHSRKEQ